MSKKNYRRQKTRERGKTKTKKHCRGTHVVVIHSPRRGRGRSRLRRRLRRRDVRIASERALLIYGRREAPKCVGYDILYIVCIYKCYYNILLVLTRMGFFRDVSVRYAGRQSKNKK